MDIVIAAKLAVALALGLVVGAERGWETRDAPAGQRSAGVRTFAFAGLLGCVSGLLAEAYGGMVLAAAALGFGALVVTSYWLTAPRQEDYGITTEVSVLVTFALGALVARGLVIEAVAAAVLLAWALGFKEELHGWLRWLDRRELKASLQLLLIAAVALPLLPNRDLGPWQALNPRLIGLLVLLIAGISYAGYFAVRLAGVRLGLLITAFLGGLASSTAVTVAFARMARARQEGPVLLGAGIALAAATMAPRLLFEVAVVNRALVPRLALPIALLGLIPLVAAAWVSRAAPRAAPTEAVALRNPLDLGSALIYGAALTLLFLLVRAADAWLGVGGVYALTALSAIADVDAVGISLAHAAAGDLSPDVAATAIVLAAVVNTASKAILAAAIGGAELGRWSGAILGLALAVAIAAEATAG
jgi:uncharacterized membrane protein (DUF4010 family)